MSSSSGMANLYNVPLILEAEKKAYAARLEEVAAAGEDVGKLRKRWEVRSHVLDAVFNKCGPVFGAYTKCFKDFKDEKTCRRESSHAMLCNKSAWDKASYRCGDRFLKYQLAVHEESPKEDIEAKQTDFRQCMLRDDMPLDH